jgi:putative oxidoreductase
MKLEVRSQTIVNDTIFKKIKMDKWKNLEPYLKGLLRIVAALMFMMSGSMKLFAFPAGIPPHGDTAVVMSQAWIGGVLEFFGGLMVLIGFYTRPVAFVLAGEMAVAYFQFHFPQSPWPIVNMGTNAVLYCFIFLYFSAAGPGKWSVDRS